MGPEITSQYHPTSYIAYDCDGDVTWRVAGTDMIDRGENVTFTFNEVAEYIIHATCDGKEVSNQALTVEVSKSRPDNPIPTPDNPIPTPDNPIPKPPTPPYNPVPSGKNPEPNPPFCFWWRWWCR